jgi:aryl-alcohol dehydrogenase-like predicted oxidoreductase
MRYRVLGGTGIEVSTQCLGAMMFGSVGNPDHDDVVLATKVHFQMGEGRNRSGNSRRWILAGVEASLKRLQTGWIDLYQVHRPDETTDIEETLSVLTDLMSEGKIRAFGCSTFRPADLADAHHVARQRNLHGFRTEQPPYSLLARGIERSMLPLCERYRMGVLTWSPLAFGFLTGRFRKGLADDIGCTLPELALAFPLAHPSVTSVIIGPRTMGQLEHSVKGATLVLDDAALDRIDEIVPPGTDVYNPNTAWTPRSLADPARRRRQLADRAAA